MNKPLAIIAATLFVTIGLYRYGYHNGWSERDAEMQVEIAKKNNEARKTEQEMTQKLAETSNALQEANNVVTKKQTALDAAIRAGRVRLPTPSCVSAPQSAPTPTGNTETRSEPNRPTNETSDADRATLAAIAEIVAQGDRNTAQLNACVDAYTKVMESINGQR